MFLSHWNDFYVFCVCIPSKKIDIIKENCKNKLTYTMYLYGTKLGFLENSPYIYIAT
jgi:hypothetical protein